MANVFSSPSTLSIVSSSVLIRQYFEGTAVLTVTRLLYVQGPLVLLAQATGLDRPD